MSKRIKISDLRFDPENARVRTAKGEAMIQESLQQVGAARSIVIDEDGTILAGNGTVEAAGQVGIDNVVIVEASGDEIIAVRRKGLTDEQKKKLAYYDNRTGDEAEWDMEQVAADLLEGFDFLDDLFDEIPAPEPETKGGDELPEDPAEVLREKWGVEYGDLWYIGEHRILCGDSTNKEDVERLLGGSNPDCVVTDPPYGIGIDGQKKSTASNPKHNRKHHEFRGWDSERPGRDVFSALLELGCPIGIWGGNYFADLLPASRGWVYWDKGQDGLTMSDGELAWTDMSKPLRSVTVNRAALRESMHPTQKPVDVMSFLINYVSPETSGGAILDVYAGSGTTLVAAHNEGRTCYAMEIDPAYVAVCLERMAQLGYSPEKSEG